MPRVVEWDLDKVCLARAPVFILGSAQFIPLWENGEWGAQLLGEQQWASSHSLGST